MEITYDYYRIFYYVAKYKSISKASEILMRGQPNITKTISNLENQLNCKLFIRSSRGVTLTAEGEKLFSHVEIAFEHILSAEEELLSEQKLESGSISIATTEIALYGIVLSALKIFHNDFKNVKIKLNTFTNEQAYNSVINGLSNFAVVTKKDTKETDLKITVVKEFKEILCCKKGYIDDFNLDINAIIKYPFISLDKNNYSYDFYKEYLYSQNIKQEPEIEVSTIDQVILLIINGLGIGFVPENLVSDLIDNGELQEIKLSSPPPIRQIYLVYNKKQSLNTVSKKFIEYL